MDDSKILYSDESDKHTDRIERLSAHKSRTVQLSAYVDSISTTLTLDQKHRYNTCHSYLVFHNYLALNKIKLSHVEHCDMHLLCPLCAIRRASKKVIQYEKKVQELLLVNPKLKLYYVVLTVKDDENLLEAYKKLTQGQKTLTQRRREAQCYLKTGNKKYISAINSSFAHVEAGAYSIEVKRGKNSGLWHPHTNFLLLTEHDIKKPDLINEWESITGDSFIVHCENIKSSKRQDIKDSLMEIFKYAMKFSEMSCEDTVFAWETLTRRRLLGSFGLFRGLDIEDDSDPMSEEGEYEEMFYRFFDDKYRKIKNL